MKNTLFSLILLLLVYVFLETFSYAAYRIKFGPYTLYDIQTNKINALKKLEESVVFQPQQALEKSISVKPILHPYIGYTVDGKQRHPDCVANTAYDCYNRIKVYTDQKLETRANNKLVVAIVGGSFADGTARGGTPDIYAKLLAQLPQYAGREFTVYNMAGGGYKQPQQLMHINYYYALGAEFDIIINIDGFNEMAATFYGWRDSELHPAFPKSWNHRVSSGIKDGHLALLGDKRHLQKTHATRAKFWLLEGIRYSPSMNLLWKIMDNNFLIRQSEFDQKISAFSLQDNIPRDFEYEALGPDYDIKTNDELMDFAVELWADSSRALHALAVGKNAKYYHFIQPNQYIEGAKLLSDFEIKNTVLPSGGYGNVYKKAYPKLALKAQQLQNEGVSLVNLTSIFKNNAHDLYIDNCCHMNPKGYDLVARAVVDAIANASTHADALPASVAE